MRRLHLCLRKWFEIIHKAYFEYFFYHKVFLHGRIEPLVAGVLCIALPVPSIVQNFHRIFQEDKINPDKKEGDPLFVLQDELKKRFVHTDLH